MTAILEKAVSPDLETSATASAWVGKPGGPHWYFITRWECVLCGRWTEDRERRHDPRPEHWGDRHECLEGACGDHFC